MTERLKQILLMTPRTWTVMILLHALFGVLFLYRFFIAGIFVYIAVFCLLIMGAVNARELYDQENPLTLRRQKIMAFALALLMALMLDYMYEVSCPPVIRWDPLAFEYQSYRSERYPARGWLSGRKGESPYLCDDARTAAIGFGFPEDKHENEALYLPVDPNAAWTVRYNLSHTVMAGVSFEGPNDTPLTAINAVLVPAGENRIITLPLKEFEWKKTAHGKKIKHCKWNVVHPPLLDRLWLSVLLFFDLDAQIARHYLGGV